MLGTDKAYTLIVNGTDMAIASKAATANKLSDPYVIATSIGKAPYYN